MGFQGSKEKDVRISSMYHRYADLRNTGPKSVARVRIGAVRKNVVALVDEGGLRIGRVRWTYVRIRRTVRTYP